MDPRFSARHKRLGNRVRKGGGRRDGKQLRFFIGKLPASPDLSWATKGDTRPKTKWFNTLRLDKTANIL